MSHHLHIDEPALSHQIRFQKRDGTVWFGEQRMVMLQMAALATFRKEVIETVGLERAKGFFMRLGYSLGQKDALLARKLYPDATPLELLKAGFALDSLKGMVRIEQDRLHIEPVSEFIAEYRLSESYEAEMFRTELGLIDEPGCWSLVGHASAFTSNILGQEMLFKETSCRACGHETCHLVGRPAEAWDDADQYRKYFVSSPIIEELYELQSQLSVLRHKVDSTPTLGNLRGKSAGYRHVCSMSARAAEGDVSVLLLGETGVGKELVAQGIHHASERREQPFVAVNCAAIPPDLIEAELFGVNKGAYTGATHTREGKFERAHGGTIFLDEVIELSPRAQASLLRVIQEGELERVGDTQTRNVNVRIIAATNESLEEAIQTGRFRADLYYRLNVYPIQIPPLRERQEDIPVLIDHFLEKYQAYYNKRVSGLSDMAQKAMREYAWPGNVRELENLIERGLILTDHGEAISAKSLFPGFDSEFSEVVSVEGRLIDATAINEPAPSSDWIDQALAECGSLDGVEERLLEHALQQGRGNISEAARFLGISRPTLAYRLKKMEQTA